jgi:Heterokaryon incompatibility protein (HET)
MMWGIYKFAKHVVVWLRGPEDDAKLAMQLIFDAANPSVTEAISGRNPVLLPTKPDRLSGLPLQFYTPNIVPFHFDALAWGALAKLLERPYFRRVWIIQEIVAAKDAILVCRTGSGNEVVYWEDLVKVIKHLGVWEKSKQAMGTSSVTPWSGWYQENSKVEIRTRWGATKHARESDAHSYC